MNEVFDLLGIGIGPFNLSLAALLARVPTVKHLFLEKKAHFDWHPEIMFPDSNMQTSYLKDLVTPVDPTNPYSFLNYLSERNLFYHFLNTQRTIVSRREFEQYCAWVSKKIEARLRFGTEVHAVRFDQGKFQVETRQGVLESQNLCVATGHVPRIPAFAPPLLGPKFFHAKSPLLKSLDLRGKSVAIVGGGQTGVEVFRNALHGKWGEAKSVRLLTRRRGLEPLDESAFTNEVFTPTYLDSFWGLGAEKKAQIVTSQKFASDGNTPAYLFELYNDLYRLKHVEMDPREIRILACRSLRGAERMGDGFRLRLENTFTGAEEELFADVVILSTGFESRIPEFLAPLFPRIHFDAEGRFQFQKSYAIEWAGPKVNRIYALNFSRHHHGIIDPQTSLMAWRSGVVVNDLTGVPTYRTEPSVPNFIDYQTPAESRVVL